MIKIIKPGNKTFTAMCSKCGCEFSYELEDLDFPHEEYVKCPECGDHCYHKGFGATIQTQPFFGTAEDCATAEQLACLQGNHDWQYVGESTEGSEWRCRKCWQIKTDPIHSISLECKNV